MRRGKNQVLFRYLPESVVDFTDTKTIGKVSYWIVDNIAENIDLDRVSSRIISAIKSRKFKRSPNFNKHLTKNDFTFISPKKVKIEMFPLTLQCRNCNIVQRFTSVDDLRINLSNRGYKCPVCRRGSMYQLPFVHYHECGFIDSLQVRPCSVHKYSSIFLDKRNSSSPSEWEWRCKKCNFRAEVIGFCRNCNRYCGTAPFRKTSTFNGHSITMINTSPLYSEMSENVEDLKVLIGVYFNYYDFDKAVDLIGNRPNTAKKMNKDLTTILETVNRMKDGDPLKNQLLQQITGLKGEDTFAKKRKIIKKVEKLLPMDDSLLLSKANIVSDYIRLIHDNKSSIKSLLSFNDSQGEIISDVGSLEDLKKIGISNAYITNEFPLVTLCYGYSRGKIASERREDIETYYLVDFPQIESYPEGIPIFSRIAETEGIVLEFDRNSIINWLVDNRLVDFPNSGNSEDGMKAWFLSHVNSDSIPFYDEINPLNNLTTKYIYGLIHTITHLLLRNAAAIIGLDKNSLGEIVFPEIPLGMIYDNQSQEFHLGVYIPCLKQEFQSGLDKQGILVSYVFMTLYAIPDRKLAMHVCTFRKHLVVILTRIYLENIYSEENV